MAAHLWTKKPPPWEYIELVLCRDVFHCTPSQLRKEQAEDILNALAMLSVESHVNDTRAKNGS